MKQYFAINHLLGLPIFSNLLEKLFYNFQIIEPMKNIKINKFLSKLFEILDNPQYACIICWDTHGQLIFIIDQQRLKHQIIPSYFAHNNFNSFVRQLHLYGFHKVKSPEIHLGFSHKYFLRDNRTLSTQIRRNRKLKRDLRAMNQMADTTPINRQNVTVEKDHDLENRMNITHESIPIISNNYNMLTYYCYPNSSLIFICI